ncbi:MAG: SPOR domain-containing protein [Prevotella sp.]|nr:SPOR domain-containing protein [Prevotella sp.]MBR4651224.1 SPOR domain-containing protein [Prevotella sp.]
MELSRHIEILLLDNDCVIVPGFGGFMAHYIPAEYVEEDKMFYPPQRTLGFNPQLQLNDSLLAQAYVEAYDISYPEAVRQIAAEVEEVRQVMSVEGEYNFHGLGTLRYTSEEKYDFHPCAAGILTPTLYGLGSFEAIAKVKNTQSQPATIREQNSLRYGASAYDNKEEEKEQKAIVVNMTVVRNVLMAAMLLLLFVFSSIPVGIGSNDVQQCSLIDTHVVSSLVKEQVDTQAIAMKPEVKKVSQQMVKIEPQQMDNGYTIVLASKVSKAGADELVVKMTKLGFKSARVVEKGTMRRVVLGIYSSESDASNALRRYHKIGETFTDAWISEI